MFKRNLQGLFLKSQHQSIFALTNPNLTTTTTKAFSYINQLTRHKAIQGIKHNQPRRYFNSKIGADDSVTEAEWRKKFFSWKTLGLSLIPITCFMLGTWQVKRLNWKNSILDDVNHKMHQNPIPLPLKLKESDLDEHQFRKVIVYGLFDHDKEMLVGPKVKDGNVGHDVVTPLIREDGSRILVKRGWIKKEFANKSTRPESLGDFWWPTIKGGTTAKWIDEPVVFRGFLRKGQKPNRYTPPSYPERNEWYIVNTQEMAEWAQTQPILVEEIFNSDNVGNASVQRIQNLQKGIPIPSESKIDIPNDHLQYLVTWYSLCLITSAMLYYSVKKPSGAISNIKKIRMKANSHL